MSNVSHTFTNHLLLTFILYHKIISESSIIVEHYDGIITIGINRPEKKNCLDVITAQKLSDELDKFEENEKIVAGVLHGVGGNFCSGYDLTEIAQFDGENEEKLPHFGPLVR